MQNGKVNVVIADDNLKVRKGLRNFLEKSPDITVLGEACNGQEAVELIESLSPDILLLDIQMPVMDGITAMKLLRQRGSSVQIIIVSAFDDPYIISESCSNGAHSYILKEEVPFKLLPAITKAFRAENEGRRRSKSHGPETGEFNSAGI